MKYKVGDRVKIKSLDWYNENKNNRNEIIFENNPHWRFVANQSDYCGQIATVTTVNKIAYRLENIPWNWTDEMIEGLVEDTITTNEELFEPSNVSLEKEMEWNLPKGYQFVDENGNVINATKIVLEKLVVPKFKKGDKIKDKNNRVWYVVHVGNRHFDISSIPNQDSQGYFVPMEDQDDYELCPNKELPKTYEECCTVLRFHYDHYLTYDDEKDINPTKEEEEFIDIMSAFSRLIVCRNAYWKIAGEQMGLGKPWEPDYSGTFEDGTPIKYVIYNIGTHIVKERKSSPNHILSFPTEEMRDAFYENFKKEIEECKELL